MSPDPTADPTTNPTAKPTDPAAIDTGPWRAHWREPYLLLLSVGWPQFLALVTTVYLLIHLLFAGLYRLDPPGIGGTAGVNSAWARGLFFSVQTLGSIGYGALYPNSLLVNLLVTAEALLGLIFIALTTGLVFARFARTAHRIAFAAQALVHPWNGEPVLELEIRNTRRNTILACRLEAFLATDAHSREGRRLRRLQPLILNLPSGVALEHSLTAQHPIDAASPLQGLDPEALRACRAEIWLSFSGIDETLERPLHVRHCYRPEQLLIATPASTHTVSTPQNGDG